MDGGKKNKIIDVATFKMSCVGRLLPLEISYLKNINFAKEWKILNM